MTVNQEVFFENAPVNEVALGRTFLPRPDFLVPHFGVFWAAVRDQFPKTRHASPIVQVGAEGSPPFPMFDMPLPRVWFMSADEVNLMQLQQDRFHLNWRRTESLNPYVRFPTIQADFLKYWTLFEKLAGELLTQPLQPATGELSYVNIISLPGAKSSYDIAENLLWDFKQSQHLRFLPKPSTFNGFQMYELPGAMGSLRIAAASAVKVGHEAEPLLRLELTVSGKCSNEMSFEKWSSDAHNFLVAAFKDLTQPVAHSLWLKQENNK